MQGLRFLFRIGSVAALAALAAAAALPADAAAAPRPPELRFEGPEFRAAALERLRAVEPESFLSLMDLLGLADPGPPIRVLVAAEGSIEARRAPSWSVGYAIGEAGLVVLLPSRIPAAPTYPDNGIAAVLRHEIAHVLIARAARRRPIPRWFNEGLAVFAVRNRGMDDRTRLVWATFRRGPSLADLDAAFHSGAYDAGRAYALASAFVRFVLEHYGEGAAAAVLRRVGDGEPFGTAFRSATGVSLAVAEDRFWSHLDFWNKWLPFLTSSAALWTLITALALWAFKRRRDRDLAVHERWQQEELAQAPTDGWIH
jgi:Peptidase MA superfamily